MSHHEEIDATLMSIDDALATGDVTLADLRGMLAPHLLDAVKILDESEEGRALLDEQRANALRAISDHDYAERAYGSMVLVCIDQVQGSRKALETEHDESQSLDLMRARLSSICNTVDLACLLLHSYAWPHRYGTNHDCNTDADTENHRETWRAAARAGAGVRALQEAFGLEVTPRTSASYAASYASAGKGGDA